MQKRGRGAILPERQLGTVMCVVLENTQPKPSPADLGTDLRSLGNRDRLSYEAIVLERTCIGAWSTCTCMSGIHMYYQCLLLSTCAWHVQIVIETHSYIVPPPIPWGTSKASGDRVFFRCCFSCARRTRVKHCLAKVVHFFHDTIYSCQSQKVAQIRMRRRKKRCTSSTASYLGLGKLREWVLPSLYSQR